MTNDFRALLADDQGQALVEYGLILALIAVVSYAAVQLLGKNISTMLNGLAGDV